jgi:uncharacterized protein YbjT (DUF2867 family)
MKTALVVGASGLIGNVLTIKLLESSFYSKVKIVVRKKIDLTHQKLEQIIIDFDNLDESKIVADDIFCCLGTTMKIAKTKANFYKVDFTYPLNIAKAGLTNGAKQFLIITAMGADEKSLFYYNRVKGEVEKAISDLHYPTLLIFRPSMLSGERKESRFGEKIGSIFMNLFDAIIPDNYKIIKGEKVAQAMLELAQKEIKFKDIFESGTLQKYN